MKLACFINKHVEQILGEWDSFARTLAPAADVMSVLALRDHAKEILLAIAVDMETHQSSAQQVEKSKGLAPESKGKESAASIHGALRQASDFSLLQLSAEFRALRATVLRLWLPQVSQMTSDSVYEMVRFNEAIDQALSESVVTYSARAEHMRDLFLGVLGHDLRTPLAAMEMAGKLLTRPALAQDQVLLIGARVGRSASLMSSMVDDLLGYSQTQLGGGMPVTIRDADIADVCKSVMEEAGAAHQHCQFSLKIEGDLKGSFDNVRLHQLFANLLSNAAQYGARDTPIMIDAKGGPDAITVQVTNQGPVIPEASLQSIFTPLIQLSRDDASDTRPRTSLGLGLFVAREIAVAHGGTIDVTSNEQEGTTFTVRLPRK